MDTDQPTTMQTEEQVLIEHPPLHLPIDDALLIATLDEALRESLEQRKNNNIDDRSKEANNFWKGQHVNEQALDKRYQMAHVDNVIYQDLENRIMLAAGRTPDIIFTPPDRSQKSMEASQSLQSVIRERIDSNTIKRLLKDGLRNMHTDFIAVIKPRWDVHRSDFSFELLLSENVYFAKGSKVPHDGFTIDGTPIVLQWVDEPLKVVMAKFPAAAQQLLSKLAMANRDKNKLPSHVRYLEAHFTWYSDNGEPIEGVAWKFQDLILDKMREPYYDWDGDKNFFDMPHKPYILFSYQNRGRDVYETTTTVEQAIPVNRIVNKRLRQVTELADRAVPKLAFKGGLITAEMARNISSSPKEAIMLTTEVDDIRKEMAVIPAQPANRLLYEDLLANRGRIDSLFATHGTTRGENRGEESGISKQISREGDLVTSDDIVDIVLERVVYEMACWALQFMRLYYDEDRDPVRLADKDGGVDFVKLSREVIDTGVDVVVKASTNDKQIRRSDAMQMLEAKAIDPYTLFEDLDVPNPKERLKRLLSFQMSTATPGGDFKPYLKTLGIELEEGDEVAESERARADIAALKNGQQAPADQPPTEAYLAEFIRFINGPEFAELPPETQAMFQQHIQQLRQQLEQGEQQPQQQPGAPAEQTAPTAPSAPPAAPPQGAPDVTAALQSRLQGAMA